MKKLSLRSLGFLVMLACTLLAGSTAYSQQTCNGSLLFNQTNDISVKLPLTNHYYTAANSGYTWECWIKLNSAPGSTSNDRQIISAIDNVVYEDMYLGFGWHGGVRNRGYDSLVFKVDGPGSAYPSDPNCAWAPAGGFLVNTWYHVAGVADYKAGRKYLYVNCALVDAQVMTVAPNNRVIPTNLSACNGGTGANSLNGNMDEVRIWDRALTASEIKVNCGQCLPGTQPNLFLYYRCNQAGALNVLDATANSNTGTFLNPPLTGWSTQNAPVTGTACTDACKCLGSLDFDAVNNPSVQMPLTNRYYTDVNGGYTWETWFKFATAPGSNSIDRPLICAVDNVLFEDMYLGFGWHGGFGNRGYDSLVFKVDGPSSAFPSDVNCAWAPAGGFKVGQWYHAAGVANYTLGKKYLYVNGVLVSTQNMTVTVNTRPIQTNLSACGSCTPAYTLDGKMDEVRIWDIPLTAADIAANYQKCRAGTETNLVVYYRANQVGASAVLDGSTNGFNGSFVNLPGWSAENAPVTGTCRKDCNQGDGLPRAAGIQPQIASAGGLTIYPNPSSGTITVAAAQPGLLTVYAITGQVLAKIQVEKTAHTVKLEGYTAGIYLYTFTSGSVTTSGKLVIE